MTDHDPEVLVEQLRAGDRAALARAITLIESTRSDEQEAARKLVRACLPFSGHALRIGITGIPGVGKSTVIDVLGRRWIEAGHRVAVLAVDPSSARGKGSILGDKTRMDRLASDPQAFVRPTATGGALGGVARRTREAMVLCEAAGYDRVIIETVGVGQNELAVDRMTDLNLLLMIGGAGDELQGIKRGIMEAADLIALNKTDQGNEQRNARAASDLRQAIALLPARESGLRPEVLLCSAVEDHGVQELKDTLERLAADARSDGRLDTKRRAQEVGWMHEAIEERLLYAFRANEAVRQALPGLENAVRAGERSPFDAAEDLLALFRTASGPLP